MPRTHEVTVRVADLAEVKAAMAEAVAAERRRLVVLVRATCACQSCKDDIARLLTGSETGVRPCS